MTESEETVEEQADPTLPSMVLDFPQYGLKWPVPLEVGRGIEDMLKVVQRNTEVMTLQAAYGRVSQLHQLSHSDDGTPFCVECGRRSTYPCPTMDLVLGIQNEKESDNGDSATE